jgi:hypothetical protein
MSVIPATQEAEIGFGKMKGVDQLRQKVQENSSQPIKPGYSGTHLSSQLLRKQN